MSSRGNLAPEDGVGYLLTGKGFPMDNRHKDFEFEKDNHHAFLLLVTGPEATMIWKGHSLYCCIDYPTNQKKKLSKVLKMEEVASPAFSAFVGT